MFVIIGILKLREERQISQIHAPPKEFQLLSFDDGALLPTLQEPWTLPVDFKTKADNLCFVHNDLARLLKRSSLKVRQKLYQFPSTPVIIGLQGTKLPSPTKHCLILYRLTSSHKVPPFVCKKYYDRRIVLSLVSWIILIIASLMHLKDVSSTRRPMHVVFF